MQSDYELFSCESKNLGKKLKRYCEILSNAPDYIMGEENEKDIKNVQPSIKAYLGDTFLF